MQRKRKQGIKARKINPRNCLTNEIFRKIDRSVKIRNINIYEKGSIIESRDIMQFI